LQQALESEGYANQRRYVGWINYLLSRAELSWLAGDPDGAGARLDQALDHLERSLIRDGAAANFMFDSLLDARFLAWQQRGVDLFAAPPFAGLSPATEVEPQSCTANARRVRQAILSGDGQTAEALTLSLLGSGYYEPSFIRTCRLYDLCQGSG
jgi:hypothetical protein